MRVRNIKDARLLDSSSRFKDIGILASHRELYILMHLTYQGIYIVQKIINRIHY